MKILITGGAGFIASHIGDEYIKRGHKVVVIDSLTSGFKKNVNPRARFYKGDIRDANFVHKVFKKERPEAVNHHAAIVEVVKSLRDPIPTLQTNALGTANVLIASGEVGVRRFIFSSTGGAMYGAPKKLPVDERAPRMPFSPYGISKVLGEDLIEFYARRYGFSYIIFRYANVYGPRQNPHGEAGVVAIFGGRLKHGEAVTIFGSGKETRDYVYVDDVARANTLALRKGKDEIINIGRGVRVPTQEIYDVIARACNVSRPAHYKPLRKGEIFHIALHAAKAKKILGWTPRVTLEEGIKRTLTTLS